MRKAGFLQSDRDTTKDIMNFIPQVIGIMFIGPCIALIPFVIPWVEGSPTSDDIFIISLFESVVSNISILTMNKAFMAAFAGVPFHFMRHVSSTLVGTIYTLPTVLILRYSTGLTVLPLGFLVTLLTHMLIMNPILDKLLKLIPVTDPRTGHTIYFTPRHYLALPRSSLCDQKVKASIKRINSTDNVTMLFGLACTSFLPLFIYDIFLRIHLVTSLNRSDTCWSFLQLGCHCSVLYRFRVLCNAFTI